jgi:hypothetical protein
MSLYDALPYDAHDHLPPEDLAEKLAKSDMALQAEYYQACTDFRVTAAGMLATHGALDDGRGWAIYDLTESEEGSTAMADGSIDALLCSFRCETAKQLEGHDIPSLRIMTNEVIVGLGACASV